FLRDRHVEEELAHTRGALLTDNLFEIRVEQSAGAIPLRLDDLVEVASDLVTGPLQLLDPRLAFGKCSSTAVPDIGILRDNAQVLLALRPDQDRHITDRLRRERRVVDGVELAIEGEALVRVEKAGNHRHRLVEHADARTGGGKLPPVPAMLVLVPARADAADRPAIADVVDGDDLLGKDRRVTMRIAVDQDADVDAFGLTREGGKQRRRLEAWAGFVTVETGEMVEEVHLVEAKLLAQQPLVADLVPCQLMLPGNEAEFDRLVVQTHSGSFAYDTT